MKAALRMVTRQDKDAPTLREYTRTFYVWGECSWIKRQHAKGKGFNRQWAQSLRAMLDNHVLPRFGSMKLDALNRPMIEKWLVDLPLSNQTKNHCLYMMRNVLREAAAEGIIKANPLEHAEPMGKNGRKRDVFTLEELRYLFPGDARRAWCPSGRRRSMRRCSSPWRAPGSAKAKRGQYDGGTSCRADGFRWSLRSRRTGPSDRQERGNPRRAAPPLAQQALSWWHDVTPFKAPETWCSSAPQQTVR